MNKLACIGLITLSVLSCSVSRDSKQRLYKQEKDSISAIRIDHLFHKAGSDSQNHLSATLRQVTLSIPDSTGRQYPLSVTTATLRQRSRRSATDTSSRSSAQRSVQTGTATHVSQRARSEKTGGSLVVMASTGPCPHRDFKKKRPQQNKNSSMNHKRNKYQKRINIQLTVAVMLCLAGLSLLFMGFWCSPTGEIHNSVLIGFGEVSTFAGALFGVDYKYKEKRNY